MVHDLAYQAKRVIDTLYNHLFDNPEYEVFSSSGPSCVKSYGYNEGVFFGAEDGVKDYASAIQDRVTSVATSVSSAAAETASTMVSSINSNNNNNNHDYWISVENHHSIFERLQSIVSPAFWHRFDHSSTTWDSIAPDLHALQSRLGLGHIAQTLNIEPRILFLAMLLPLTVLLLGTCAMAGAGHVSEDGPHAHDYGEPGRKTDPTNVREKENQSVSSSSRSKQFSEASSSTPSNTGKSGKNRHGSKKGGTQDQGGSLDQQYTSRANQYQIGSDNEPNSWATMLGSTGFMGAEIMDYKPIDIIASLKKLRGSSNRTPEPELTRSAPATSSADHAIHDEGVFSTIMEDVFGPSDTQNEQDGTDLDNHEGYDEGRDFLAQDASKSSEEAKRIGSQSSSDWKHISDHRETNTDQVYGHPEDDHSKNILEGRSGKQGAGPAGPGSESLGGPPPLARTRVPRAHKFKEADRHRHQPHVSYDQLFNDLTNRASNGGEGQWNVAAKIVDFTQGNAILRNLDGISGGVFGAVAVTFAAFVDVAEVAVTRLKMIIPPSMNELTRQLRDDFGRVMDEGDLEGSGVDQDENWSFRNVAARAENSVNNTVSSSSQPAESMSSTASFSKPAATSPTIRGHEDAAVGKNYGHTRHESSMAEQVPRLRQRSVTHGLSSTAAVIAAAAKDYASNKANQTGQAASGQRKVSVDDIWVGPHTASAVYAEPIKRSNADKDTKKKAVEPSTDDGRAGSDDAVDPPKAKDSTLVDRDASSETAPHFESPDATRSKKSKSKSKSKNKRKKNKAKLASQDLNVANADQGTADHAEDHVENTAQDIKKAARVAGDSVRKSEATVERDIRTTVQKAEDTALKVVGDAKVAVTNAEDALQLAARDTKKTIDAACGSAQMTKDTLAQGIEGSVKDAKGAAQGWAREAEDAMQRSAMNAAHQAKAIVDSAVGTVQDVVETGLQRASLTALEPRVRPAAHKTKSSRSKEGAKNPQGTEDSANTSASRDLGKDESKTKNVLSSRQRSKVGDMSPEPKSESSRDILSSAKHLTGGVGDATSEVLRHGASIVTQTATIVTDNTAALLEAAKNEVLGSEMEHKHDQHGQHKELRDIKNEMKHEMHHRGIGSSQSSAAKKAEEAAKEYYDSLPKSQESSSRSDSTWTGTQKRKSKSAAIPMLDHDNYVFMDRDGGQIHMDDIDDDADESDGSVEDDNQSEQKDSGGILSHAPSILQSAKLAASAVAARVADVSYENFDIARHSLSDMIDNLSENLAGQDEPDEPDEGSDGADEEQDDVVVVPPTRNDRQSFSAAVQRPASSTTSTGVQRQQQHHTEAHPSVVAPTRPSAVSDHATSGTLSYSGAVKLNKDESDHGPMYGTDASHTTKRPSQGFIHPHDDYTSESLQGTELHTNKSPSHGRKGITSAREPEPSQEQEYTTDEHGNKVVFDARRDSGFDLLV